VVEKKKEEALTPEVDEPKELKETSEDVTADALDESEELQEENKQDEKQIAEDIFSGRYGDVVTLEEFGFEPDEPILKGKRKEPKPSLLTKVKEKFKNSSFRKKLLIGVAAIVIVGGVATAALISNLTGAVDTVSINGVINDAMLMNPFSDILSQTADLANNANQIDYSAITEGHTIYDDAYDAAGTVNQLVANEWVQSVPHDVYDVVNHEYLGLTQEQLNDPVFMKDLMSNGNYSLLVGDGNTPSGFISAEDFMNMLNSGRSI